MNINAKRKEYKRIVNLWIHANCEVTMGAINKRVIRAVGKGATPDEMIAAAKNIDVDCGRCAATGRYQGRGNGGTCYRCGGKGWQDWDDVQRNMGYDIYLINNAA